MHNLFLLWFGVLVRLFSSRGKLVLEHLALRQQLAVLKRRHPEATARFVRQTVLGHCPSFLVRLERSFDRRHAGDGGSMASGRLPFLLALDLPGPKASRQEKSFEGGSRSDLPDGR
jgi:hypothetical protein